MVKVGINEAINKVCEYITGAVGNAEWQWSTLAEAAKGQFEGQNIDSVLIILNIEVDDSDAVEKGVVEKLGVSLD